jgi:peptide/nickel transport system substrate-binding protein
MVLSLLLSGCASAGPPAGGQQTGAGGGGQPAEANRAPKRMTAALLEGDITSLREGGGDRMVEFLHSGLARMDPRGGLHAALAEAVPTIENGLWQVLPDGRMIMTWKIRADAKWHDGTPVSSADFIFGTTLDQDRDLPWTAEPGYSSIESIEAPDAQTIVIRWKQPYIEADAMTGNWARLWPRHILEPVYRENKAALIQHRYWTSEFVGAGPYKLREFAQGSHILMDAFSGYPMGRPRIDEVEVKLIPDPTVLVANLLSGTVDMTVGLSVGPDETALLKAQWRDGAAHVSPVFASSVGVVPQFRNSTPSLVTNLTFRRALLHGIDRQEMVDTIQGGMSKVAHSYIATSFIDQVERDIVRYDYDPRRAAQLLEELGYRRGSSGLYEDASGQRLSFELWGVQEEAERVKATTAVADYWTRMGLDVHLVMQPRQADREVMANFPAFANRGISGGLRGLPTRLHSSQAPRADTRWAGNNLGSYNSPELDSLLDRFFATIPNDERLRVGGQLFRHVTENVVGMGLFYNVDISMVNNRLTNVTPSTHLARAFDPHLWDVQ